MFRLALLLVALLSAPARATQVEAGFVPCPIGGELTRVHRLVSQNAHGGYDSDGARYSSQGQWRTHALATCPEHLLSLYGHDMAAGLAPGRQEAVRAVVNEIRASVTDPDSLPIWERYRHAARVYRALGADGWEVAQVYLNAAWTVRDEAVGVISGVEGPEAARALLDTGTKELRKALPADRRKVLLFNLARIAHRGGYLAERGAFLAEIDRLDDLTPAEEQVRGALHRAARLEPEILDQALGALEAYEASGAGDATRRAHVGYLLGDLHRRCGRPEKALPLLRRAAASDALPDPLREMARFLVGEVRRRP